MGDFPLMTDKGTFVINGTERVVVSQLVRSPGVYFEKTIDKATDKDIFVSKIIPSRGAWLEFEIDKKDMVGVRVDRKRKQPVTVLLKALGWTNEQILEEFGEYESIRQTLEKDHTTGQDDALLDIYRKLRPGEPPTREAAQTLLENFYFNPKRYDLAKVGRYKVNKKLGLSSPLSQSVLTVEDIVATIRYIVRLHAGETEFEGVRDGKPAPIRVEVDDIDHFGNRRLRTVGELIQNQVRIGLARMERVVRERMTTQDVEAITPQTLINIRPVVAVHQGVLRHQPALAVHGPDQPAGRADPQAPPLGARPRRPSRERAGFEVRDVHPSHYGRMCPIETPEGPNIGLIGSLATYARVNPFGFVETPYRQVVNGKVTDTVHYLTADEEDLHVIAQANAPLNPDGTFAEKRVLVRRKGGEVEYIPGVDSRLHGRLAAADGVGRHRDDPVPRARRREPRADGLEHAAPVRPAAAHRVAAGRHRHGVPRRDRRGRRHRRPTQDRCGRPRSRRGLRHRDDRRRHERDLPRAEVPPLQPGHLRSTRSRSSTRATAWSTGQVSPTARAPTTARWRWARTCSWRSCRGRATTTRTRSSSSQRLVQDDVLSSIHIEEHEVDARDTKLGPEEITRDIPNVSEEVLADLDERGIIRIGAEVATATSWSARSRPRARPS